jgi:membrane protein implicated in regulation of membrane protease activity
MPSRGAYGGATPRATVQFSGPPLVTFLAGALGVAALLLVVAGVVATPVAFGAATPFAVAAALLWYHASGRFTERVRERVAREERERQRRQQHRAAAAGGADDRRTTGQRRTATGSRNHTGAGGSGQRTRARSQGQRRRPSRETALRVLGLEPGASQAEIKRAYRERVKEVHPDRGGDEEAFQRVTSAYEFLRE